MVQSIALTCRDHSLDEISDVTQDNAKALYTSSVAFGIHRLDLHTLQHRLLHETAVGFEDAPAAMLAAFLCYVLRAYLMAPCVIAWSAICSKSSHAGIKRRVGVRVLRRDGGDGGSLYCLRRVCGFDALSVHVMTQPRTTTYLYLLSALAGGYVSGPSSQQQLPPKEQRIRFSYDQDG